MVETGELGVTACLLLVASSAPGAFQFVLFDGKHGFSDVFGRMTFSKPRAHQLPLTQSPSKIDERFYRPVIAKFR